MINRNNYRNSVFFKIIYMSTEIFTAFFKCVEIFFFKIFLCHAAVIFHRANSGNENNTGRFNRSEAAFYIEKFFRAQIGAEACLGNSIIRKFKRCFCSTDAVTAMSNIRKRSAVHNGRSILQSLNKIRLNSLFEQNGHCSVCFYVSAINGLTVICVGNKNIAEPFLQIKYITAQAQHRHYLACNGNAKMVLTRHAVKFSAERYNNTAKSPVIHIKASFNLNSSGVDIKFVTLLKRIVEHGTHKIIGRSYCMHIARKMKINVLHRNDLGISAACRSALNSENRTE